MFTKQQEEFLAAFADKGLAELADAEDRNNQILIDMAVNEARTAKLTELKAQADALIEDGMNEFDTKVAPTIAVGDEQLSLIVR